MKTAKTLFKSKDKEAIAKAIADAEKLTAGEIIPVVATDSGRYDRAEDHFALMFSLLTLTIVWLYVTYKPATDWGLLDSDGLGLLSTVGILIIAFIVGTALAAYFPALRLPFVARKEKIEEVERRAFEMFQRRRLRNTVNGTGILIYVSLYERIVRVIGDDAVAAKLSDDALEEICSLAINGLKENRAADGLCEAIVRTGELLSMSFPPTPDDRNELANDLILID